MFRVLLVGFLIFGSFSIVVPTSVFAMSLDDEEEDSEDVADLLREAKDASKSKSFSKAESLLKRAKMYGVMSEEVKEAESFVAKRKKAYYARLERERKEKERLARLKREREERARRARQTSYSNYGLPKSRCYLVSSNYALYKYCNSGSCDGFSSNYALYSLCKDNNTYGFNGSNRNTSINIYLRNGGYLDSNYFSSMAVYQSGQFNGSFQDRKNFILYLLSGKMLRR